ncbi:aminotransferase class I/II-fold pyridoxal phosphate-dependent enzyme [Campylobacter volucris]|uniref:aminotransferase class I/II-fold pyridoxal phosphate-dependent enzyme n=1 Tax=Campylobacter volucris TaxID=1031542 RepID=UPI0005821B57|nr:histidinol-phosphate transaminase [Campylobacter volucris]AJC93640.1 histidinol-phosphate / aromatic aminotransferase [Campylobacter volucris LMG 24379]QEL07853.1 aminotransferase, HisC family [Campylobacter volucris]
MIKLTEYEKNIQQKIIKLKMESGSHSPSIFTIAEKLPELKINIDSCFLSNPYATALFLRHVKEDLIDTQKLRSILEFYPSQNNVISKIVGDFIGINADNMFIGNGAIEIIQAVMHNFVGSKIVINIPTFSSYYEFAKESTKVVYYQLSKENNYMLDLDDYINFIKLEKPDSIVLINPNNPDGGYISYEKLKFLLKELYFVKNIIIDESFIHFAFEDLEYNQINIEFLFKEFDNLIFIKSMSKDFGIAGIRVGYGIMSKDKVQKLLYNGYLWNSSGFAEYFLRLYTNKDFFDEYNKIRIGYIKETQDFFNSLGAIEQFKVYPSKTNFALVEILDGTSSEDFVSKMLIKYGIYMRTCKDKIGLNGEFVRIASRTFDENEIVIKSIHNAFKE